MKNKFIRNIIFNIQTMSFELNNKDNNNTLENTMNLLKRSGDNTMNLSQQNRNKELFSGEQSLKENTENNYNVTLIKENTIIQNLVTFEDIFIYIESLTKDEMYDLTIINDCLEKLENMFIHDIHDDIKKIVLHKWKIIFTLIGYDKDCYIFQWLDNLYNSC
jgi:hypothetical protein